MLQGRAQNFAEWFKQNSTRLKYYARQITALQGWLGTLQKEYQIAGEGLGAIGDSKQGEFTLHNNYYASLGQINPSLAQLGEVAEIAALQAAIIRRFTDALVRYRTVGLLGSDRLVFIGTVYTNLLKAGLSDVAVLSGVLTADKWQMTDDQRMARIRAIDETMRDRYSFALAFTDRLDLLEGQLLGERAGVETVKAFYGCSVVK